MAYNIEGYDGIQRTWAGEVSGRLGEGGVVRLPERLAAGHLSEQEIIAASLRPDEQGYSPLLKVTEEPGQVFAVGEAARPLP